MATHHNSTGLPVIDLICGGISLVAMILAVAGKAMQDLQAMAYTVSILAGCSAILFGVLNYLRNKRIDRESKPRKFNKKHRK